MSWMWRTGAKSIGELENPMRKVQIIRNERDEPAFAVVPWADYEALTAGRSEDDALIARGRAARGDESFPADVAKRLAKGEPPLKVFREWRKLSQGELGRAANVAPHYISQIERGERGMGKATARKLAPVLRVSLEALLD